jgi:hypothetical protein
MSKLIPIIILLCCAVVASGVNKSEGEILFSNMQFDKSKQYFENQLKRKPKDVFMHYMLGRCCYELKDYNAAISHLEQSTSKYLYRDQLLGEMYFNTYHFEESVKAYQSSLEHFSSDEPQFLEIQNKLSKSEIGARLLTKVEDIAIVDSIVVDKSDFLNFYRFADELGTLDQEQIALNGQTVDKVKYITQRKDRIYFSDTLHGQLDLFSSYKLMDEWSKPDTLPFNINSSKNENYPFLLLDGITMYFATDGLNSLGGYDLFVTKYSPATKSFLTPENVGMPFNSPYNDYMMVIDEQRKLGWFASDRYQIANKIIIYTFQLNENKLFINKDDVNQCRQVAQLKQYRKVEHARIDSNINDSVDDEQFTKISTKIQFFINDTIVYNEITDFKSLEAKKNCIEYQKLNNELQLKKLQLEELRQIYSNMDSIAEKKLFTQKIIELEKRTIELERILLSKMIQIRNLEIKLLQKNIKVK